MQQQDTESEAESSSGHDSDAPQRMEISSSDEGSDGPLVMGYAHGSRSLPLDMFDSDRGLKYSAAHSVCPQ